MATDSKPPLSIEERHFIIVEIVGKDVQPDDLEFIAGVIEAEVEVYDKSVKVHTGVSGVIRGLIHQIV